jgi:hypothetical protein
MYTLNEYLSVSKNNDWESIWFALSNFLDDFKRCPNPDRLESPPKSIDNKTDAFLAGCVEHLSRQHQMPIPSWVKEEQYYLKEPFFPSGLKGSYRIFLLIDSPISFKSRNIYVEYNVLSRC